MNDSNNVALPDDELIRQTARGNEQAFLELYQRHHRQVFNYVARLTRNPEEAQDLLQDVFLAVWRGASGFRGEAGVKTWLFRIAHHQTVSWLRRRRPVVPLEEWDELGDPGPEQLVIASWQRQKLSAALDRLSVKHRAVLELAFVHEMSYNEIAKVVGCPVGTVKSRMSYALQALSGALKVLK